MADGRPVLVVDDDPDIREALQEVLEDEGIPVVCVEHGRAALDVLRREPKPCVVLLDLMMPVMDGRQFRAEQLEDPRLRDVPVVVFSAGASAGADARALGVDAFVKKPIQVDRLLEIVRRFV